MLLLKLCSHVHEGGLSWKRLKPHLSACYRSPTNTWSPAMEQCESISRFKACSLYSSTVWNKIQFHTWVYKQGCGNAVCITELGFPPIEHNFLHSSLVAPKKFTKSSKLSCLCPKGNSVTQSWGSKGAGKLRRKTLSTKQIGQNCSVKNQWFSL